MDILRNKIKNAYERAFGISIKPKEYEVKSYNLNPSNFFSGFNEGRLKREIRRMVNSAQSSVHICNSSMNYTLIALLTDTRTIKMLNEVYDRHVQVRVISIRDSTEELEKYAGFEHKISPEFIGSYVVVDRNSVMKFRHKYFATSMRKTEDLGKLLADEFTSHFITLR